MVVTAPTQSGRILGVNASANNRGVTLYGRFSFYAISSNHPTPRASPSRSRWPRRPATVPPRPAPDAVPILVVDDDPETLRHLRDTLAEAGYAPLVTGDPGAVARIIRAEKPRLVLLDLMLPGTDGIELMQTVPELADLPVIFISGYGSVAVFVWAVVGLIRPTWARLPSRAASVGVWVLSVVLFIIGGALMPDSTPEQTEQSAALGSQSVPPPTPEAVAAPATDERVHPESDFQAQVQRLIQQRPLGGDTTEARAFHNDLTLTVNREASALLASTTCDQQRDLAASVWLKWSEMDVGRGAGVTIQSYTGRILASAEEGFTGPQFHCD